MSPGSSAPSAAASPASPVPWRRGPCRPDPAKASRAGPDRRRVVRPPIPTIAAGGTAAGRPTDKEPSMFNLALALIPSPGPDERRDAEEGFLGKLVLRAR